MKSASSESFETLHIPKKDFPQLSTGNYRIYKNAAEYILVTAATALEAMQSSGITPVYKIERDGIDYITVLAPGSWTPASTEAVAEEVTVSKPAEPAAQAAPEAPLSGDDVSKLLNG